jgi:hypothetical protein
MAVLLSVSFILTGCPTDSSDTTDSPPEKSGNAALNEATVKGVAVDFITGSAGDGDTIAGAKTGVVTITSAADGATAFP